MAQNLIIANATYSGVPAVDISKVGGGTARFMDTSDATAVASDIRQGQTAYVGGQKVTGTATGGAKPEQSKTTNKNGTVYPDAGYALSSVTVAIPYYEGE